MSTQTKMFLDPKSVLQHKGQLAIPQMVKRNSHRDRRLSKLEQERSKSRPTSANSTGKAANKQSKVRRVSQMVKPVKEIAAAVH